jgi:glyoxylase-like metal-dependent hydrolase (beta-lactamase superfamily II)
MTVSSGNPSRRTAIAILAALAAPVRGESTASGVAAPEATDAINGELLRTGLYLLRGGGCQSLLRLNAAGCVLVDGKRSGTYRSLMRVVRRINRLSDLPLRGVIYTNHHDVHAGNHAEFLADGVSAIAQVNALPRLPAAVAPGAAAASGPPARPVRGVTGSFEREHHFTMGGVEVRLHHFGPALTDNDTVVLFPDLKVLAIGELLPAELPTPDYAAAGSLPGWSAFIARLLELDFDVAVPSAGAPVPRSQVEALKSRIDVLVSRARSLMRVGTPPEQFAERLEVEDLGWRPPRWDAVTVEHLYADLAHAP